MENIRVFRIGCCTLPWLWVSCLSAPDGLGSLPACLFAEAQCAIGATCLWHWSCFISCRPAFTNFILIVSLIRFSPALSRRTWAPHPITVCWWLWTPARSCSFSHWCLCYTRITLPLLPAVFEYVFDEGEEFLFLVYDFSPVDEEVGVRLWMGAGFVHQRILY